MRESRKTQTEPWKVWLAFKLGCFSGYSNTPCSGRDVLRHVRAGFDQMGVDESEWYGIESAALCGQPAIALSLSTVRFRVMKCLAGSDCPIGPIERTK